MTLQKVVIAGGTGFVGTQLTNTLLSTDTSVTILTRSAATSIPPGAQRLIWDPASPRLPSISAALANADLVVNLAGHPVISRWSDEGKQLITSSRINATSALVDAIIALDPQERPKAMASASAVGFYGPSLDATFDETSAPADDFLADLCVKWEDAARSRASQMPETRLSIVRIGIVMGKGGGALANMMPFFNIFLGGPVGSGDQIVSWVHIDDLVKLFIRAGEQPEMSGVYNGTAPNPVSMKSLSDALGAAMKRPSLFPVPPFVLKLAFGEGANVLLQGQRVLPNRAMRDGFEFQYPNIEDALKAVVADA